MRNRQQKQTNEEPETDGTHRQINEEKIFSTAVQSVPRDEPAQCCLCLRFIQSSLCSVVKSDFSGVICLHSAVRHPAQTMKQACGPNTLPSCFRLPSAPVRTSGHMTWLVIAWRGGGGWGGGALWGSPHLRSPWNPCSTVVCQIHTYMHTRAHTQTRRHTHTDAKPLCTNAFLSCRHTTRLKPPTPTRPRTHTQIRTHIISRHRHMLQTHIHSHSCIRWCIHTCTHSTHNS